VKVGYLCAHGPPITLARVPLAEIDFVHSLLLLVVFAIAMAWTWTLFMCFADLIRDRELSGWGKAIWVLALLVPILGCLVYLAARGSEMEARAVESRRELWK
jgi:Phospholipase_D-nuclease N-terminal